VIRRAAVVSLLFVLSWIMYLDRAAISTAKDLIGSDLALSDDAMGLVFGAFALGYALAQTPSGLFADRAGPRLALTAVVTGWSIFTGLTGAVRGLWSLLAVRFLFGAAEAGAFPGSARVLFAWLPARQHGRANGIIFSGSRLGAAFSFPLLAWLMDRFGWRTAFVLLAIPGVIWAAVWLWWFRDEPHEPVEREQPADAETAPLGDVLRSWPMRLAMAQYFASNFTFFVCLSWMHPYLMQRYALSRDAAAWHSTVVLLVGATAQWAAGTLVDALYHSRLRSHSRRIPAIAGFFIAASGLSLLTRAGSVEMAVICFMFAAFGAEMTISPSWAFCIDLGGKRSGTVSGSMNMVGNFGSFVSASVFPVLYRWSGSAALYFAVAALLNVIAAGLWLRIRGPEWSPDSRSAGGIVK
jgi:ACS family glucarate transporter-like MFS transporter